MDTEDREHFKTIGLASVKPPAVSSSKPNGANSRSGQDQAYCLKAAQTIAACYRRDDAHDPEIYAAAVAAVLADYAEPIVALAADPRTGVAGQSKFLPSVAEVKEFCDAAHARQERIKRYAALPKPQRREYVPPTKAPNLFVPSGFYRYARMVEQAKAEPALCRFENGHTCQDGIARDGIWVPLAWWQSEHKASPEPLIATPDLVQALEERAELEDVLL